MSRYFLASLLICALQAHATTPPKFATVEAKICLATHIFRGQATNFKVVAAPQCGFRGDGKTLTQCEEVEVNVTVDQMILPKNSKHELDVTFRFGDGLFSVDELRNDLVGRQRYYFTVASSDDGRPIYRTSYPWFLGMEYSAENELQVVKALKQCKNSVDAAMTQ